MRLFVAHRIGADPTAKVASIVSSVRIRLPRAAWAGSHAYHLTFAFLGEQEPEIVPRLSEALKAATARVSPVNALLVKGGFFPGERKPRVGWIGVEPHERLIAIAGVVRAAITSCDVRFDEKPFTAHLTLMRIRAVWQASDAALFRQAIDAAGAIPIRLDRVSLFESRLLGSGAVHTELAGFELA